MRARAGRVDHKVQRFVSLVPEDELPGYEFVWFSVPNDDVRLLDGEP